MDGPDSFFASYGGEGLEGPLGSSSFLSGDGLNKNQPLVDDLPDMLLNAVTDMDSGAFFNESIWPLNKATSNDFEPGGSLGGLGMDPPEAPSMSLGDYDDMDGIDGGDNGDAQDSNPSSNKKMSSQEGGDTFASSSASFPAPPLIKPSQVNGLYNSIQNDGNYGLMDETCSTLSSDASTMWGVDGDQWKKSRGPQGFHTGAMGEPSMKRKQDRNAREQKRSLKISQQIGHLKEVLESDGRSVKNSKMAILVSVENYIRELEGQINELSLSRQAGGGGVEEKSNSGDGDHRSNSKSSNSSSSSSNIKYKSQVSVAEGGDIEVASGVDYQSLFQQVSTPFAIANIDGRFIDANIRFEMATGYTKEELSKLTFFNIVSPDELQETFTTVASMINHPGGETRFTRRAVQKQSRSPLYITISLVRQNAVPQFFQCSLH